MEHLPNDIPEAVHRLRIVMNQRPVDIFEYDVNEIIAILEHIMDDPILERFISDFIVFSHFPYSDLFNRRDIDTLIYMNADIIPVILHHLSNDFMHQFASPQFRNALLDVRGRLQSRAASRIHRVETNRL